MVWRGADAGTPPAYSIYGQFVSASGSLVGAGFVIVRRRNWGGHDPIRLLFDGFNYFLAWEDRSDSAAQETARVYGQFVTPAGALLGDVLPVSDQGVEHGQVLPAIASDATNIFVVWVDGRSQRACAPTPAGTCYPSDIYGQLITRSSSGTESALSGDNIALRYFTLPHDRPLSVASSGDGYFVLSQERNVFPEEKCEWYGCVWDVSGFFVSQGGSPAPPYVRYLFSNYHDNASPVVAWSGSKYLISWSERFSRTNIYIETSAYYPDRTWGGNFTLASPAGGTVPGAAVPLPLGDGNFFTLINRGKPGKSGPTYGRIRADTSTGRSWRT